MAEIFIGTARRHDVIGVDITNNIVTSIVTVTATAEEISGIQIAIEHVGVTAVARV